MNKNDIIKNVSLDAGVSQKEAKAVLDAFCQMIKLSLEKGEEVKINGFGKFEVKNRKERVGVNPSTKEKMIIPKSKVASFKPGKELSSAIN